MNEERWHAAGITGLFPIQAMHGIHRETAAIEGHDLGVQIERLALAVIVHGSKRVDRRYDRKMDTPVTTTAGTPEQLDRSAFFQTSALPQRQESMRRRLLIVFCVALVGLCAAIARAEDAVVKAVIDGDTIELAQPVRGSIEVRLVGIQAPKIPLGRSTAPAWPLGPEAKAGLEALVE